MKTTPKAKAKAGSKSSKSTVSKTDAAADLSSGKLRSLGRLLGNRGLDDRFQEANHRQRNLVEFIVRRLENIGHVQEIELREMKDVRAWFREAAKGVDGFTLPDATRWHECAHLYQRAAHALCNGDLGRGADLLERATAAELEAQESTPVQVKEHLEDASVTPVSTPKEASGLSTAAVCSPMPVPNQVKIADRIRNISDMMKSVPPIPVGRSPNWWEEENEESEEVDDEE